MRSVSEFPKSRCCGCTACESICPVAAIKMKPDELGFKYPHVDLETCTACGLCLKICQFHSGYKRYDDGYSCQVYGMRRDDDAELGFSQSGGVAAVISERFVDRGSIVYGVGYTNHFGVCHKRATTRAEINEFRGSKYIQSDLDCILKGIRIDLKDNKCVVFFGTACQVAGLKSFLPEKLHNNLFCVDLICHGVSSPKLWEDHLNTIEKKGRKSIAIVNFRDKRYGWHSRKETITFTDGSTVSPKTFCLLNDWAIRESCSKCPFTNTERVGDLTIGDFWGWEEHFNYWNDNKGVSLMMINTEKGEMLFNQIKNSLLHQRCDLSIVSQPQLQHPLILNVNYQRFLSDYRYKGFRYVARKYADQGLRYKLLNLYLKLKLYRLKQLVKG